jgi:hypothetical protein
MNARIATRTAHEKSSLPNFWRGEAGGWVPGINYQICTSPEGDSSIEFRVPLEGRVLQAPDSFHQLSYFVEALRSLCKVPTLDWNNGAFPTESP